MDECCAPPPLNLGGSKSRTPIAVCFGRYWRLTPQCSQWRSSPDSRPDRRRFRPTRWIFWATRPITRLACSLSAWRCVIGPVVWHAWHGTLPSAFTMGTVGLAALLANAATFGLLWAYRHGDANMRSAWICTRHDVLGNLAVLLAALGVFGTGTGWPDTIVAAIMAALAIQGAALVIRQASAELRSGKLAAAQ